MNLTALLLSTTALFIDIDPADIDETPYEQPLNEVKVSAKRLARLSTSTVAEIEFLAPAQAQDVASAFTLLPSVAIRTNSRGEAQVFVRGATERETAISWRDMPVLVPYDNRFDLGLLTAGAVGSVSARYAGTAYQSDPRAVAATLSISPSRPENRLAASIGNAGFRSIDSTLDIGEGSAAFSYQTRDGEPLAGSLPFSQQNGNRRTNTARELISGSLVKDLQVGSSSIELSALVAHGSRGVAPESDRDPAEERVRFWRFPDSTYVLAGAKLVRQLSQGELTAQVWGQQFNQRIDSFTNDQYDERDAVQRDFNTSFGGVLDYFRTNGRFELGLFARARYTQHRQTEQDIGDLPIKEIFAEQSLSTGGRVTYLGEESIFLSVFAGLDHIDPGFVDDRAARNTFTSGFFSLEAEKIFGSFSMLASFGQKQRAPTLREMFGAALGRFLSNPGLLPEKTTIAELTARWQRDGFEGKVTVFARNTERALDQRTIPQTLGPSLQQRFNTDGFQLFGVESVLSVDLTDHLNLYNQATWTYARPEEAIQNGLNRLSERPTWLGRTILSYQAPETVLKGVSTQLDADWRGRAFSPDASGDLQPLSGAVLVGGYISFPVKVSASSLSLFARADNLFDVQLFPQSGLPLPGRTIRIGLSAKL